MNDLGPEYLYVMQAAEMAVAAGKPMTELIPMYKKVLALFPAHTKENPVLCSQMACLLSILALFTHKTTIGSFNEALWYAQEGMKEAAWAREGGCTIEAQTYRSCATVFVGLGFAAPGEEAFKEAVKVLETSTSPPNVQGKWLLNDTRLNLANCLFTQHKFEEATIYYHAALAEVEADGLVNACSFTSQCSYAEALCQAGRCSVGVSAFRTTWRWATILRLPALTVKQCLATLIQCLDRLSESLPVTPSEASLQETTQIIEASLALFMDAEELDCYGIGQVILGDTLGRMVEHQRALECYEMALQLIPSVFYLRKWACLQGIAVQQLQLQNPAAARAPCRDALRLLAEADPTIRGQQVIRRDRMRIEGGGPGEAILLIHLECGQALGCVIDVHHKLSSTE